MPSPRRARPRRRPLSPREQARLTVIAERIIAAAARLDAAYRRKRAQDFAMFGSQAAAGAITINQTDVQKETGFDGV